MYSSHMLRHQELQTPVIQSALDELAPDSCNIQEQQAEHQRKKDREAALAVLLSIRFQLAQQVVSVTSSVSNLKRSS